MEIKELLESSRSYAAHSLKELFDLEDVARRLCHEYNTTSPDDKERQREILLRLIPTADKALIHPTFHCDYGFNIHFHGFALLNYNVTVLDSSPIEIGEGVFIAPGVCISCTGHSVDPDQRAGGIWTTAPINIGDKVWIGANSVICGGVTIGEGSVIGAGSIVTRDIPAGVVAYGSPCKPVRKITDKDKVDILI